MRKKHGAEHSRSLRFLFVESWSARRPDAAAAAAAAVVAAVEARRRAAGEKRGARRSDYIIAYTRDGGSASFRRRCLLARCPRAACVVWVQVCLFLPFTSVPPPSPRRCLTPPGAACTLSSVRPARRWMPSRRSAAATAAGRRAFSTRGRRTQRRRHCAMRARVRSSTLVRESLAAPSGAARTMLRRWPLFVSPSLVARPQAPTYIGPQTVDRLSVTTGRNPRSRRKKFVLRKDPFPASGRRLICRPRFCAPRPAEVGVARLGWTSWWGCLSQVAIFEGNYIAAAKGSCRRVFEAWQDA